jgi:hypothetical protein
MKVTNRKRNRKASSKGGMRNRRRSRPGISKRTPKTAVLAGFLADGSRPASVEEVLDPNVATRIGRDLSIDETLHLCLKRIRNSPGFVSMRMLGAHGVIDRNRALAELKKGSNVGLHLLEIERRFVRHQLEAAQRRANESE